MIFRILSIQWWAVRFILITALLVNRYASADEIQPALDSAKWIQFAPAPAGAQAMRLPRKSRYYLDYRVEGKVTHVALVTSKHEDPTVFVDDLANLRFVGKSIKLDAVSPYQTKYENNQAVILDSRDSSLKHVITDLGSPIQILTERIRSNGGRALNLILTNCLSAPNGFRIDQGADFSLIIKGRVSSFCSNRAENIQDALCEGPLLAPGQIALSEHKLYVLYCGFLVSMPLVIDAAYLNKSKFLRPYKETIDFASKFLSMVSNGSTDSFQTILSIKDNLLTEELKPFKCGSSTAWSSCTK